MYSNVSYVTRINDGTDFSGQAQYLLMEGNLCCSAHCTGRLISCVMRINHESDFSTWQAQYLVMLEGDSCGCANWSGRCMCDMDQS